jgi:glucose-6-phosphate isomerase
LAFYISGNGKGTKNMVTLPYFDRLELFSKYLQQLFMESLGKEKDLNGKVVNQGLTVLGNKGSTDQHSYVQQLREGLNNFFVTFIEVLKDGGANFYVEPEINSGDFLHGFYLGTRQALREKDRESLTIIINEVSDFTVGLLIALFERAVGFYASLIAINAYHQPGVEAGKKAAGKVIEIQERILKLLSAKKEMTVGEIARETQSPEETVFKICEHLSANPARKIVKSSDSAPSNRKYRSL